MLLSNRAEINIFKVDDIRFILFFVLKMYFVRPFQNISNNYCTLYYLLQTIIYKKPTIPTQFHYFTEL